MAIPLPILLFPIKVLLISIDIIVTLVTFGWLNALKNVFSPARVRTVPVGDDPSHRVRVGSKNNLLAGPASKDIQTLYDLIKKSCRRCSSRPSMGSRKFIGWKVPGKIKHFADDVSWRTFEDVDKELHQFGAALKKAGMTAAPDTTTLAKVTTSCRLAIFENTCAEWMIAAMGAFSQGITVTTVYATLGMDAVVEAVIDNLVPVIVCNKKDVSRLLAKISSMPTLKTIVYISDLVAPSDDIPMPSPPRGVTVISFEDFCASGDVKAFPPTPPKKESTAVVMYTSGSTGKPKGVIIQHAQILACVAAAEAVLPLRDGEDVYLAYLPLAHIMEMVAEFVLVSLGCTLCYSEPKSLTDAGSYPKGALEVFSPTLMVAVPKIWDIMKKSVQATVAKESPVKQYLVKTALEWRSFCISIGLDTPFLNRLVFKKIKKAVGGKLTYALSGGGPLNSEVQNFVRTAFGITFVQGYGLTETTAICTVQDIDDIRPSIAGVVSPSLEMKLESTPDVCDKAGQAYLSTDRVDVNGNPIWGRGEVLVRGYNISTGYYMEPEKTKEVFEDDPGDKIGGWFHTGDIGQFMEDGSLRIVDRKKNLVKLKGGEYIAVEKMEMTYGNCSFVDALEGGICCYGDGEMDRPVALMQLSKTETLKWAKENNVSGDFETIMKSPELYKAVMEAMRVEHAKSDLSHLEKLVAVSLLNAPWTPENGCLTAANKLQRRAVVEKHEKEFLEVQKKGIF